ncbi:MAG: hypothetical protein WAM79_00595 [Candidatus Sulfotelmatobacter sp.]
MSFHGSPCHFQLGGDLGVITALQEQLNDLLLSWTEPNGLLVHPNLLLLDIRLPDKAAYYWPTFLIP